MFNLGNGYFEKASGKYLWVSVSPWKRLQSCVQGSGGTAPGDSLWQKAALKLDFIMHLNLCTIFLKFYNVSGENNSQLYWSEGGKKKKKLFQPAIVRKNCLELLQIGEAGANPALPEHPLCWFLHIWTCFPTFLLLVFHRKCHASGWSPWGMKMGRKGWGRSFPGLCSHQLWMKSPWSWGSCSFSNKLVGQIKTTALSWPSASSSLQIHLFMDYTFSYSIS